LTESRSLPAHLASTSANGLAATASSSVMPLPIVAAVRAVDQRMATGSRDRNVSSWNKRTNKPQRCGRFLTHLGHHRINRPTEVCPFQRGGYASLSRPACPVC
jgi:hypothetical protein